VYFFGKGDCFFEFLGMELEDWGGRNFMRLFLELGCTFYMKGAPKIVNRHSKECSFLENYSIIILASFGYGKSELAPCEFRFSFSKMFEKYVPFLFHISLEN
jgi:hypothetical protein